MANAVVYNNGTVAGLLEKAAADDYRFTYEDAYLADASMPSISLSLSKTKKEHQSKVLFPFFFGLLAEGINKDIQCRLLRIDENDDFTRLLKTAGEDTIGAITIKEMNE
ncbi:MAG TPA: HipA N-terminal domain-containing protein [Puia sp.]|jgi:HipA-like protein|nr:HipA N-terminal domain-containing protein [Puia sp.]